MNRIYQSGQLVTVRSAAGDIQRIVVKDMGEVVLICRPEEYELARSENRSPVSVGFKRGDILI